MGISLKPLREQVVVITGGSSGIGLATAKEAARRGAKVVLAARNAEALAEIVTQIERAGGTATYVAADVSRRADLERVAAMAVEKFGGFDTWVNNAGLSIFGRLEEVSDQDHRQLFEINFWGLVYGSLIAAAGLKQRGGAIINLGSVVSDMAVPMQGMYSASKHAVKGFTDALRVELEEARAPIAVTLIKPAAIDTPFPQHAKNYMPHEPKLPAPVYPPEEVAQAILHAASHPSRDIFVGGGGKAMSAMNQYVPRVMDWMNASFMPQQQERREPPRDPRGSLYRAGRDGRVRGDHPGYVTRTSLYTRSVMHPAISTGVVLAGLAAAVLLTSRSG